jgi:hypothetical protein
LLIKDATKVFLHFLANCYRHFKTCLWVLRLCVHFCKSPEKVVSFNFLFPFIKKEDDDFKLIHSCESQTLIRHQILNFEARFTQKCMRGPLIYISIRSPEHKLTNKFIKILYIWGWTQSSCVRRHGSKDPPWCAPVFIKILNVHTTWQSLKNICRTKLLLKIFCWTYNFNKKISLRQVHT